MREQNFKRAAFGFVLAATVFGCSFHNDKMGQQSGDLHSAFLDVNGRITIPANKAPGYNTVKALVFQKNCIECHGNARAAHRVNVETYDGAKSKVGEINDAIFVDETMPPRQALAFEEQQLIRAWIDAGAPEQDIDIQVAPTTSPEPTPIVNPTATPVVTPTPEVSPTPVVEATPEPVATPTVTPTATPFAIVHYAQIDAAVLTPKCLKCHSDARAAHGVNLQGYANVIKNLKGVEDEALVRLTMPPRNQPLSADEQTLLRTWIDQGAQE